LAKVAIAPISDRVVAVQTRAKGEARMSQELTASIVEHFEELVDPRIERQKQHKLLDIWDEAYLAKLVFGQLF
jgi:hypothetical protein